MNADMMSDMKTFTVRELDRSPGVVLKASRVDGRVRIRERGGQTYIITPETGQNGLMAGVPDFGGRRAALFADNLPPEFARKLDQMIAGE